MITPSLPAGTSPGPDVASGARTVPGPGPALSWLAQNEHRVSGWRRALHAHPELGWHEVATTSLVAQELAAAGLEPTVLTGGTGLVCDIGAGSGPVVALRADLDALPLADEKQVPYRSRVAGQCHACGHDVHTAALLGAGLALAEHLPAGCGRVRLIFQPAEEVLPGGALAVIGQGWLTDVSSIFALHCDPALEVGRIGLKSGPITAASDTVDVRVSGPGGHTARPQNTVDLVHVLGSLATGLPEAMSRLVDPRAGLCLVWGHIAAGAAANAIPRAGLLQGTLRVLDKQVWQDAPALVRRVVGGLAGAYGADAEVTYTRGVPPVVNDPVATAALTAAVISALGPGAPAVTLQSMGGEDFAWYLDRVPGAMARLGVRPPGSAGSLDLHQGGFDVDEACLGVAVRVLVSAALAGLA